MKLKVLSIIISLLGVGARGYFLPSGLPSPIRGHNQGRFWGQEKQDIYHGYQAPITDFRHIYHHAAAQSAIPNPQLLQDPQYIYQQEVPYQHEVQYQQPAPYQQEVQYQQAPYQQLIQPAQPEYQKAVPYQYVRNPGPSAPLTAQTTIPVVVRLPNNQAIVVPVRAVYTLPSFLERIVQRVQNYYSVYNPVEQLTLDRPLYTPTVASVALAENSTSVPQKKLTTTESYETTTKDISTETTISVTDENSTEETTEQMETTTDPSAFISPDSTPADLQSEGYTYKKPTRSFKFRK